MDSLYQYFNDLLSGVELFNDELYYGLNFQICQTVISYVTIICQNFIQPSEKEIIYYTFVIKE